MHAYFRNHQLYLAEKCNWLDRQVQKSSKRALMKIESYKLILQAGDDFEQIRLVEKLVKDSLLTQIKNESVLIKEGFYKYNLEN
jgi:peptidyl-tRNA hydrolase